MNQRDTYHRLRSLLSDHFGRDPRALTPEASLGGALLLDSLDLVDLAFLIGREFGVDASVDAYRAVHDLAALADFVEARTAS